MLGQNWMLSALAAWDRPLGRLARLPLRLIPRNLAVPVLSGPNRGRRWIVGAGAHACWLGHYEREKLAHVCRVLRPGMMVLDVGARAGFYTLALASRVGSSGRVIAIEADAENVRRLRWHLALNRVTNAQVVEAVACDHGGMVRFGDGSYLGDIDDSGAAVPAIPLDDLGSPDAIKIDIGGAEGAALAGAARILERGRAHIFLVLYGISDELALVLLQEHGYRLDWLGLDELHAIPPH
jgi:FkbM family methyltransferase